MKRIIALSINDFRIVFRDRILLVLFLIPVFMIGLLYFGIPNLFQAYPFLVEYHAVIVGALCIVTSISPAYVISFIMLDEKDEDLIKLIRVLPLKPLYFILYRLTFVFVFTVIASFLTILASGLHLPVFGLISLSLLTSLVGPIITLLIVTFAKNKIEGLTFLKAINFLCILPVLSFFTGFIGKIFLAFVPTFWIINAFDEATSLISGYFYLYIGFILHLVLLIVLYKFFKSRIFNE